MKLKIKATSIPTVIASHYDAGLTPLLVGPPGIGKTEMVRLSAEQLGRKVGAEFPVYELHLASMSEVDVRGYLIPNGDSAKFTKPVFWHVVEKHEHGILFLDEFMQANHEMQKAVAPLLLDRRVGEYELPKGWMVVCAGNGLEDNAGANELLSHVLNRMTYFDVSSPDVDEWMIWAVGKHLPPELITFAKLRPNLVFDAELPSAANQPYCTPRALALSGKLAQAFPGGITGMVTDDVGIASLAGRIGAGAATELAAVVKLSARIPAFEDIVDDPQGADVPDKLDEQYAAVMMIAVRAREENFDPCVQYLLRFPVNISLVGIVSLAARDPKSLENRKLMQWAVKNQDLLGKFKGYIKTRR